MIDYSDTQLPYDELCEYQERKRKQEAIEQEKERIRIKNRKRGFKCGFI